MASQEQIEQLLKLPNIEAQKQFLQRHKSVLGDEFANALKKEADRLLRSNIQRALEMTELLHDMSDLTGNPLFRALGLLTEANVRSIGGLGEYHQAVELYDQAAEIYEAHELSVEQAKSQVGKVFSLAMLGCYQEALEAGRWAGDILEAHEQWHSLAGLTMNMAIAHGRQRDDAQALEQLDRASQLYRLLGTEGENSLPWTI